MPTAHRIDFTSHPELACRYGPRKTTSGGPNRKTTTQPEHFALIIDDLFTPEECAELLKYAEGKAKWEAARVNVGGGQERMMTAVRNSTRILLMDKDAAKVLFDRVLPYLEQFGIAEMRQNDTTHCATYPYDWDVGGKENAVVAWKASCINEMLRFLQYHPGQYFRPHEDGQYVRNDGSERSYFTFHLYLGGDAKGGATTILARKKEGDVAVEPKVGRVLVFQQKGIQHEGSELSEGVKYTMRTDIMYKPIFKEDEMEVDGDQN